MRPVHQGAARRRHAVAHGGAGADDGARRRRRAPGSAHLTGAGPPPAAAQPLGVILAGGASRRFGGTPKGLEVVGGARIIDRVAAALRQSTPEIVLAANDAGAGEWLEDVAIMTDKRSGLGGVAGLEAPLAMGRDIVVVAWDMPFVTGAVLDALLREFRNSGADAVLPESDSPYGSEPFCAVYAARVHPVLSAFLDAGGGAARDFVARLRTRLLPRAAVAALGDPRHLFFSVNTRDDLAAARALAGRAQ